LMVAGGETKMVQVFDMNSRAILRNYTGHTRAVHRTMFTASGQQVISCSDDASMRLWDLSSEQAVAQFDEHQDYIRACAVPATADHLVLTGSYDHAVKLWDTRAPKSVMTVDHGAPVESVLMFPRGNTFISAGGNSIKVWDVLGSKTRPMYSFSSHQKTVTCLAFDSAHSRLISGSLDHQVKIYDIKDYKVVHSIKYSGPILSVALSPQTTHLAVGMATGVLAIRRKPTAAKDSDGGPGGGAGGGGKRGNNNRLKPSPGTYRFFVRGHDHKATKIDFQVVSRKKKRLQLYDKLLKRFKYFDALDAAFAGNRKPVVIFSVLYELVQRNGLRQALADRNEKTLKPIIVFVGKHIANPRYTSLLIDVGNQILDLYSPVMGQSPAIDECFMKLHRKLKAEVDFQQRLFELMGSLDLLLSAGDKQEVP